jgi:hypothetical protein
VRRPVRVSGEPAEHSPEREPAAQQGRSEEDPTLPPLKWPVVVDRLLGEHRTNVQLVDTRRHRGWLIPDCSSRRSHGSRRLLGRAPRLVTADRVYGEELTGLGVRDTPVTRLLRATRTAGEMAAVYAFLAADEASFISAASEVARVGRQLP